MLKTKIFTTLLLALAVLFAQVGTVAAAPLAQDTTPITGEVVSITIETDVDGLPTAVVVEVLIDGETQTLRLSVETALAMGLITLDPDTNQPVVDETKVGETVEVDPTAVLTEEEESNHIISTLLGMFFDEDASVIDGYHEDGFGFGVIAQAMWMSQNFSEDTSLAGDILTAKKDKDFEAFFEAHPEYLAEGEEVPTNWGQFKKAFSNKKNNLGSVVSGQADETTDEESSPGNGQGKDKNNNDKGKGKDKDKSNNGKGKGNNK
ncbi:MAG TPA: hypothetical protein VLA72_15645 [Anaerolineales bacterium]|nr:hypothetical protein [Anaerolineales bacterium]